MIVPTPFFTGRMSDCTLPWLYIPVLRILCLHCTGSGPYTLGKVNCRGNETSLFDCPVSSGLCDAQFSSGDAGVLCYAERSKQSC